MYKVVTTAEMRDIEAAAAQNGMPSTTLMENAGRATAERVKQLIADQPSSDTKITILVGSGNNGGDALVAGRILMQETAAQIRFYLFKPRAEDDPLMQAVQSQNAFIADAQSDQRYRVLINLVASATIILDGIFGIGVRLPLRDDAAKLLRAVKQGLNEGAEQQEDSSQFLYHPSEVAVSKPVRPYVIAIDCPTGLNCDTGELDSHAIFADETITFIAAKPGLFQFPGAEAVGKLTLSSLGIAPALMNDFSTFVAGAKEVHDKLPSRPPNSNKGTFGKALIIGGSANYIGAPVIAAQAAYLSGVGLVTVGAPSSIIPSATAHTLEATWLLLPHDLGMLNSSAASLVKEYSAKYQAMLVGIGMGNEKEAREFLLQMLRDHQSPTAKGTIGFAASMRQAAQNKPVGAALPPLVIDADGLNILSESQQWWEMLPPQTILTPHPGEMARLSGMSIDEIQSNRLAVAQEKAQAWNVVLVLKGAHTIVAAPDGETAIIPFKLSALAKAGTGDALAGIIVGLLAQGLEPFTAAWTGAYIHGLAGKIAAEKYGERSVGASSLIKTLAEALQALS